MTHKKDALGQDIRPNDIVAWSAMGASAGPRFARVIGESEKMIRVGPARREVGNIPFASEYSISVRPENVIVVTKLVP